MSETAMLSVKTVLDDSGLRALEKELSAVLRFARAQVSKHGKDTKLTADIEPFVKVLEKIEQNVQHLRERCAQIELKPDTAAFQKELKELQEQIGSQENAYHIAIEMDPESLPVLYETINRYEQVSKKADERLAKASQEALTNNLNELDEAFKRRQKYIEQVAASEEDKEAKITEATKEHLEARLKLLEAAAKEQTQAGRNVSAEIIRQIHEVEAELKKLAETDITLKDVVGAVDDIKGPMFELANQLDALNQQRIKNRLDSLKKSHERELELLQEKLDAEMAMYDEQLEQYADLEKDKEELTKEHNENMDELNSEMQDHLTEEEWLALQERMNEETLRYEESMAALEADTIARDEIQRQKELAEQEAMARKEQMEKEYAIRKAKLERKQTEATKKNNMFQAIVTTAAGIARAFADHAFPMSAAIAALVGAAGAVQIAAISAQPLPEIPSFRHGGVVGAANIHKYPQLPGPDNPYDKTLIWAQKGERVLNLQESGIFQSLADSGYDLSDLYDRMHQPGHIQVSMMEAQQARTSGNIDNSKHNNVAQNLTIQARNELTFAEARRLARKQNRALVRALA